MTDILQAFTFNLFKYNYIMTQEIRYQINGWPEKTIDAGTAPSRGPGTSPEAMTEPPLQIRGRMLPYTEAV